MDWSRFYVLLLVALCGCSSGSKTCAPAGIYVPTLTRSAAPGDCPSDVNVLDVETLDISDGQFCGTDPETFSGTDSETGHPTCSYSGSGTITASSTGISGHATIESSCWGDATKTCTANYDIVFAKGSGDGGIADVVAKEDTSTQPQNSSQCTNLEICTRSSNYTCSGLTCTGTTSFDSSLGISTVSRTCFAMGAVTVACSANYCSENGVQFGTFQCSGDVICNDEWDGGVARCPAATTGTGGVMGTGGVVGMGGASGTGGVPAGGSSGSTGAASGVGGSAPGSDGATGTDTGGLACTDAQVPPSELCNGKDDDCDGLVDEDFPSLGQPCNQGSCQGAGVFVCNEAGTDVKCTVSALGPTPEVCDGIDNNCNGLIDEQPGPGEPPMPGVGVVCGSNVGECKPGVSVCTNGKILCEAVGPTPEICDGKDNDCNGSIDDGLAPPAASCNPEGMAPGQPMAGECRPGIFACRGELGWKCQGGIGPVPEICDGKDNDCDGVVDNNATCPVGYACFAGGCVSTTSSAGKP